MSKYIVETDKAKFGAWYTPRELVIVLNIPRKYLMDWVQDRTAEGVVIDRIKYGRNWLYYIPDVHRWLSEEGKNWHKYKIENWQSRWIYLAEHRISGENLDDWVVAMDVLNFVHSRDFYRQIRVDHPIPKFDYGGIMVYLKAAMRDAMYAEIERGRLLIPLKAKNGQEYATKEAYFAALEAW